MQLQVLPPFQYFGHTALEQTQQPGLKAWWAFLKGRTSAFSKAEADYLGEALASIQRMYPLSNAIKDFLSGSEIPFDALSTAMAPYLVLENGKPKNFYGEPITNPKAINEALVSLSSAIETKMLRVPAKAILSRARIPRHISQPPPLAIPRASRPPLRSKKPHRLTSISGR